MLRICTLKPYIVCKNVTRYSKALAERYVLKNMLHSHGRAELHAWAHMASKYLPTVLNTISSAEKNSKQYPNLVKGAVMASAGCLHQMNTWYVLLA